MENLFEILATDLKIDKTAIQTAVEKHNIFLLDNEKLSSLKKTVQDESYNKAHGISYKNAIKDLAAKFEFEIDPSNDFDSVKNTFETKIKEKYGSEIEKIKADFSKSKDEKFKDLEKSINEEILFIDLEKSKKIFADSNKFLSKIQHVYAALYDIKISDEFSL